MTRYFRLEDDVTILKRWHLGSATLLDGTEPRLRAGIRFDTSEHLSIPVTHAGRALDFCLTSFAVPVVVKKIADAVSTVSGNDVQLVPVSIASQADMFVLNALRVICCVDEMRSEFVKWTKLDHRADLAGQYRQITRLVLDVAAIPANTHVFRIAGSLVELVVSEQVKGEMESAGCLGAKFIEILT